MVGAAQRWTLAFADAEIERTFQAQTARATQRMRRIVWTICFVIYAALPFLNKVDAMGGMANFRVWILVRFALGVPVLLFSTVLVWTPVAFYTRFKTVAAVATSLALLGQVIVVGALLPNPTLVNHQDAGVGFILGILVVYILVADRVIVALLTAVPATIVFSTELVLRYWRPTTPGILVWCILANIIGCLALWQIEQSQRSAFLANFRSEELLHNVLPAPIADRLKGGTGRIADHFSEVTVLFGDLVGFTTLSARLSPAELVAMLDEIFSVFDEIARRHGLEKIKTIGDAYMVVGGLPETRPDHAEAIAEMALEMRDYIASSAARDLRMRIGIHSGPVVAGVIGKQKFAYDLWGDTVNTASRMESHGVEGKVQVSQATFAQLQDRFELVSRGPIQVKGKGELQTWFLEGRKLQPNGAGAPP